MGAQWNQRGKPQYAGPHLRFIGCAGRRSTRFSLLPFCQTASAFRLICLFHTFFRRGVYRAMVFAPLRCPKLFRFPFALFVGCSFCLFCSSLILSYKVSHKTDLSLTHPEVREKPKLFFATPIFRTFVLYHYIRKSTDMQGLSRCCGQHFYCVAINIPFSAVSPIQYTEGSHRAVEVALGGFFAARNFFEMRYAQERTYYENDQ